MEVKRFAEIMCNESSATLIPTSILVLVLNKSNFLFFSCYFWKQLAVLKDCQAQEMCFGSCAS